MSCHVTVFRRRTQRYELRLHVDDVLDSMWICQTCVGKLSQKGSMTFGFRALGLTSPNSTIHGSLWNREMKRFAPKTLFAAILSLVLLYETGPDVHALREASAFTGDCSVYFCWVFMLDSFQPNMCCLMMFNNLVLALSSYLRTTGFEVFSSYMLCTSWSPQMRLNIRLDGEVEHRGRSLGLSLNTRPGDRHQYVCACCLFFLGRS